jgi:hypothetical protein
MSNAMLAALLSLAVCGGAWAAPANAPLEELRRSFTVGGKPVPPEVFADLGDADIADSGSIRVTIDLIAATGSNLYADDIKGEPGGWITQTKVIPGPDKLTEIVGYEFNGVAQNGLLVVTASYSGGGSGDFFTLHFLDAAMARAFDNDGKPYDRLNLTAVRSIALGDRWNGAVKISGNKVSVLTKPDQPAASTRRPGTQVIEAVRP